MFASNWMLSLIYFFIHHYLKEWKDVYKSFGSISSLNMLIIYIIAKYSYNYHTQYKVLEKVLEEIRKEGLGFKST